MPYRSASSCQDRGRACSSHPPDPGKSPWLRSDLVLGPCHDKLECELCANRVRSTCRGESRFLPLASIPRKIGPVISRARPSKHQRTVIYLTLVLSIISHLHCWMGNYNIDVMLLFASIYWRSRGTSRQRRRWASYSEGERRHDRAKRWRDRAGQ